MILNYNDYTNISENLKYHIENTISLSESIFRIGSDSYLNLINEVRKLYLNNKIELSEDDKIIVEKLQTGTKGIYLENGKEIEVDLDLPEIAKGDDAKKHSYIVYRPSKTKKEINGKLKAIKIGFGHPDYEVANFDEERSKSFLARMKCDLKKDLYTSGWWSCNIHLFWKQLKLKSDKPW